MLDAIKCLYFYFLQVNVTDSKSLNCKSVVSTEIKESRYVMHLPPFRSLKRMTAPGRTVMSPGVCDSGNYDHGLVVAGKVSFRCC